MLKRMWTAKFIGRTEGTKIPMTVNWKRQNNISQEGLDREAWKAFEMLASQLDVEATEEEWKLESISLSFSVE